MNTLVSLAPSTSKVPAGAGRVGKKNLVHDELPGTVTGVSSRHGMWTNMQRLLIKAGTAT